MQIDAQAIENMLITFIIHDYDVEKKKKTTLQKHKYKRKNSFPFHLNFKLKSIIVK
jgi:hypothetical protein